MLRLQRLAAPLRSVVRPRLDVRSLASRVKPSLSLSKRVMSTAVANVNDNEVAKPAEESAVAESEGKGILGRGYEWYPVCGLALAAAITQEWWIMDEHIITGGSFMAILYSAYVLGYDRMETAEKEAWDKLLAQSRAAWGIRLDMLKRYQSLEQFSLSHAEELRNLYAEEQKINEMAVEYQNLKHQFDTRNAVLAKLNSIKVLEDDARRQAIAALSKKAGEYVTQAYASAPDNVKLKAVESGIANIADELTTRSIALSRSQSAAPLASDDPVKLLFDEFLSTPRTFEQLGVENYVQKFIERRSKKADH